MKNNNDLLNREILAITFPMLLVGISTPLLGMVDTAVVGHLSEPYYLAAVALGAPIFSFLFWGFGFLRMSTTGLTSRLIGEVQTESDLVLVRGLMLAVILGLAIIILQHPLKILIFSIIETTPEVIAQTENYFNIRIWSAPATLANYVFLGWFLGQSKPRFNVIIVLAINSLNIVLDLIFVVWLEWNTAGVAWATVIAEFFGLCLSVYVLRRHFPLKMSQIELRSVFEVKELKNYLSINIDVFLRTILLLSSFAFFSLQGAKYGPIILAANAVLMNLQVLLAYGLDSLAHSVEVLAGKYRLKETQDELRHVLRKTLFWSVLIAAGFTVFYIFAGELLIGALTGIPSVQATAEEYLLWIILSPLISVWSYWFDGYFIGSGLTRDMRNTMFASFVVFIVSWFVLLPWENQGLWLAFMLFMLSRGVTMAIICTRKGLIDVFR